jgi:hypothetical protein
VARTAARTGNRVKLTGHVTRTPVEIDGLPLDYQEAFSIGVGQFGPEEMQKALVDAETIASLLRKYPKEMASISNNVLSGHTDDARKLAVKIGLTEETFQQNGGGLLFWIAIAFVGGFILTAAAFSK